METGDWMLVHHPRYRELLSALDANQTWRTLGEIGDEYHRLLSAADLAQAERRPSPSHFLLERLSDLFDEPLKAEETRLLLDSLGGAAAAAAEVLRPPQPLTVRPIVETNSECVWVPLGGCLTLLCEADAWPAPSYQWRCDGRVVPPDAGGQCARLALQPFAAANSGQYSCEVRDCYGMTVPAGPPVIVEPRQAPPQPVRRWVTGGTLHDKSGLVTASASRAVQLHVEWSGWPEPRLRWLRGDVPIPGAEGDTLTVEPTADHEDATYICVADNAVGEVPSEPFRVEFDRRPMILEHPKAPHRTAVIGRPMQLMCKAYCRRQVKVVWRRSVDHEDAHRDEILPHVCPPVSEGRGVVRSEVHFTPEVGDARRVCRITCEFHAEGDAEHSFTQSRPAEFRVVYAAPTKMALIIGNSDYHHLEKLPVVKKDVDSFRNAMHRLGFGTLVMLNLTTERSRRALRYFASVTTQGSYLVVLVAGHGFTQRRQDYLAPVDHPPLQGGGVDPGRCLSVLDDIERLLLRTSPKLLLLCGDMCRTVNEDTAPVPAATPPPSHPPTANVVRLFSTQMGHEAMDDSKFMKRLLQNIERDITVQDLGAKTLQILPHESHHTPTADLIQQYPIMEMSMAEKRSLTDQADQHSILEAYCENNINNIPVQETKLTLNMRWSNYVWDAEPELLLTLSLRRAPSQYYVDRVLPSPTDPPTLRFFLESDDPDSPVSSWRVTGLPVVTEWPTVICLRPVVVIFAQTAQNSAQISTQTAQVSAQITASAQIPAQDPTAQSAAPRQEVGVQPPLPIRLMLHPRYGLMRPPAPQQPPAEVKISNVPAGDA